MKRLLFSLLFVFCCIFCGAQKKSEVFADVRKTVDEYFMPDFNDAVELPEWRDPANGKGLSHCSSVYIEPNHFFRNGKVCSSYAAWVDRYCTESLHGRVVEHVLTLDEDLQKVRGDNDLYRIGATLVRKWVGEDGPDIPEERLTLTFQWRGVGKLVYIMHLDGDIRPIRFPAPVVVVPSPQTKADKPAASVIDTEVTADADCISDSSLVGYFFEELVAMFVKEKNNAFWLMGGFFLIALVAVVWDRGEKLSFWLRISNWLEPLGIAVVSTILFFIFWYGIVHGAILAFNMCTGKHKPSRVRLELLESYDSYRVAAPYRAVAVARDGKWGLADFKGALICPMALDSITGFGGGCAVGWSAGRAALVPLDRPVSDLGTLDWYSNISPLVNGKALIEAERDRLSGTYYLYDTRLPEDEAYKKLPYSFINLMAGNRYLCRTDKKVFGLIDGEGNVIVEPVYGSIGPFYNGLSQVKTKNGKYGFIDLDGKAVIPPVYDYTFLFSEGRVVVVNDKKRYGYMDRSGNQVIPIKYKEAKSFKEGLAAVKNENNRWGYLDKNGQVAVPFGFTLAESFEKGFAVVKDERGRYGCIDRSGKVVIPFKYKKILPFKDGLAAVKNENDRWGFLDKGSQVAVPFIYTHADDFHEGLAAVKDERGRYGCIDRSGKVVIPFNYKFIRSFSEGLAAVSNEYDWWGYIDKSGKVAIPLEYQHAWDFSKGQASVKLKGKWCLIDKKGNVISSNK